MKKRIVRLCAGVLTASMAFGIAGCSKQGSFTAKKFEKIALENLDAEEMSIDDIDKDKTDELQADLMANIEDGIYMSTTGDDIMDSDWYDEDIYKIVYAIADVDFDVNDVSTVSTYVRGSGDKDDFYAIGANLIEFKDKESAAAYYQSILHNINRGLTIVNSVADTELSTDSLDKDNFSYNGKNSGHIVLKISTDDLDIKEIDDYEGTLVMGLYIEGNDVFTVISACTDAEGNDETTEFFKLLGMKNPYDLESTEVLVNFINDIYDNANDIVEKWQKKLQNSSLGSTAAKYL